MAIAKITGQGLRLIAILVALLWGCVLAQHSIVRSASNQRYEALRDIRMMRLRVTEPAAAPVIRILPRPPRRSLG